MKYQLLLDIMFEAWSAKMKSRIQLRTQWKIETVHKQKDSSNVCPSWHENKKKQIEIK